jgi:hypothetical protein
MGRRRIEPLSAIVKELKRENKELENRRNENE